MIRYQDFNFDTIWIRYFTKYRDIGIDIFKTINMQILYKQWNKMQTLSKAVCFTQVLKCVSKHNQLKTVVNLVKLRQYIVSLFFMSLSFSLFNVVFW